MNDDRALRALQLRLAAVSATLPLLWGLAIPRFLLLDVLALGAAQTSGVLAGVIALIAALTVAHRRARSGSGLFPARAAMDVALLTAVIPVGQWLWSRVDGRVPYLESFSLLSLELSTGWAVAVIIYIICRRAQDRCRTPAVPAGDLPSVRRVVTATSAAVALLAAVVLGVGLAGRAAGARDRDAAEQMDRYARVGALALNAARGEHDRRGVLRVLRATAGVEPEVLPLGETPALVRGARAIAPNGSGFLVLTVEGRRHVRRAPTTSGMLWVVGGANVRPPVQAPDDISGTIILALLVFGAPLAAWVVSGDTARELDEISAALEGMGPRPISDLESLAAPSGVPISTNDEVGELAEELNANVRSFAEENRRLLADLEAAAAGDQARSRFLAAASHELRTPLNTIIGYCHLLARGGPLTEPQREDIALIRSASGQLLGHVDEILDLSRIEAGDEAPLERTPVDLAALARAVLAARAGTLPEGVTVSVDAGEPLPLALVDRARIRQVLENLIGNALKFTDEGFVQISVGGCPEGVHVQVADSGPGIPEGELESIFVEFHRIESQRVVAAGTGLGLAISRRLVERHDGRLWAESTLGEGSTFHLVLPAVEAET